MTDINSVIKKYKNKVVGVTPYIRGSWGCNMGSTLEGLGCHYLSDSSGNEFGCLDEMKDGFVISLDVDFNLSIELEEDWNFEQWYFITSEEMERIDNQVITKLAEKYTGETLINMTNLYMHPPTCYPLTKCGAKPLGVFYGN